MHKVISPISSCMDQGFPPPQGKATRAKVKPAMCHIRARGLAAAILTSLLVSSAGAQPRSGIEQTFATSLTAMPQEPPAVSGSFYIPAYSSVSMSLGKLRADFSVTLSIHNASETRPLILNRIAYYDTSGKLVESYLNAPVAVKPF